MNEPIGRGASGFSPKPIYFFFSAPSCDHMRLLRWIAESTYNNKEIPETAEKRSRQMQRYIIEKSRNAQGPEILGSKVVPGLDPSHYYFVAFHVALREIEISMRPAAGGGGRSQPAPDCHTARLPDSCRRNVFVGNRP